MILINRDEKDAILEQFPKAYIVRTMKQDSKRKHYYVAEERGVLRFLNEFRLRNVIEEHPPRKKRRYNNNNAG